MSRQIAERLFIVDDQNLPGPLRQVREVVRTCGAFYGTLGNWKQHLNGCPLTNSRVDSDSAAVCPDDSERCRETETSSGKLCREKGIEDFALRIIRHSATVVGHVEAQVLPGWKLVPEMQLGNIAPIARHSPDTHIDNARRFPHRF